MTATSDTVKEDSIEQLKCKLEQLGEKEKRMKKQIREMMVEDDDFLTRDIYNKMDKKIKEIQTEMTECKVYLSDFTGELMENFNSIKTSMKSCSIGAEAMTKSLSNLLLTENKKGFVHAEVNNNNKDECQNQTETLVMSPDQDEWQCNFCQLTNDPEDSVCQACDKKRQPKLILRGKDDTDPSIQEKPVVDNSVQRTSPERQVNRRINVQEQSMPNLELPDISFISEFGARPKQKVMQNAEPCQNEFSWTCNSCHQQNSHLLAVCLKCKNPKPSVDIEIFENGSGDPGANLCLGSMLANTEKDSRVPVHSFGSRLTGSQKDSKAEEQVH